MYVCMYIYMYIYHVYYVHIHAHHPMCIDIDILKKIQGQGALAWYCQSLVGKEAVALALGLAAPKSSSVNSSLGRAGPRQLSRWAGEMAGEVVVFGRKFLVS